MSVMNLNLLPSSAKFQAAKIRLQKKLRLVAAILIGGWMGLVLMVWGLSWWINNRLEAANKKYDAANSVYLNLKDEVIVSQNLKQKAKLVAGVLDKRFEYGESFEMIQGLFDEGVTLDRYNLMDVGMFKVEGRAADKESVDQLEKLVLEINDGEKEGLKKAELTSLSVKSGVWNFIMEVSLQ